MKDMSLSKEERKAKNEDITQGSKDKYPWGLEISLDDEALTKLGVKEMYEVGKKLMLHANVVVESISESDNVGESTSRNMRLQITHMELGKGKENPEEKSKRRAGNIYKE